jgi:hypothetical protein
VVIDEEDADGAAQCAATWSRTSVPFPRAVVTETWPP